MTFSPLKFAKPPEGLIEVVPAARPCPRGVLRAMTAGAPGTVAASKLMPRLPLASSASTTGWVAKATPPLTDRRWLGDERQLRRHGVKGDAGGLKPAAAAHVVTPIQGLKLTLDETASPLPPGFAVVVGPCKLPHKSSVAITA